MNRPNLFKRQKNEISFSHLQEMMTYYPQDESVIDHVTWQDLTMDDIYAQMEETLTSQGDEALFYSLHKPLFDQASLSQRSAQVEALRQNQHEREALRQDLKKTGRLPYDFRRSIQEDFNLNLSERLIYIISPLTLIGLLVLMLATRAWNIGLLVFLCITFNGMLHFKFNKKYGAQIDTLAYTYKLLNFCSKYQKKDFFHSYGLSQSYSQIKKTHMDISFIFQLENLSILADYLNILFLIKERRYVKIAKKLAPKTDYLFDLYQISGTIDLHQSMACFLEENRKPICRPNFYEGGQKRLEFKDLIHPLLKDPVANSLNIDGPIIITGSNMSGKSTFLRTIGVNVLLAQTWNFAYASEFSLCPLHIISSISLQDNINAGASYFLQEANAIRRMLDLSNRAQTSLFLIDEIFKGTNPVERIASATEICLSLARANTLGLVATHDLQLIPQIPTYTPYYFTEKVSKDDLSFDYKIHLGITTTRNAVKILEFLKYNPDLIQRINRRIAQMETM